MALFWQVVTLLSVWLLYGFAASLFVKGSNKRDYLLLISSGLLGGLIGGRIGNILDVPENIWWLREVIKQGEIFQLTIDGEDEETFMKQFEELVNKDD